MRNFPRQIEADLLFRGVDVYDWHRGRMCSARLVALIDALPDDSAFQRERRDGDWSLEEYLRAAQVNELRRFRADQAAIHADFKMDVTMVESPSQVQEQEELDERVKALRAHVLEQMNKTE